MAKKEATKGISKDLRSRIEKLANLQFSGNRSLMARSLEVDQPTISRVLSGLQEPSAKLLERLAQTPKINLAWLFLGQGEPFIETGYQSGKECYRPIVDRLLPGPLVEHSDLLTGECYPVAAGLESTTTYWYRVAPNSPITKNKLKVKSRDLLLLETDRRLIGERTVTGKLVVFSVIECRKRRTRL